jgi:Chaperone of endosialidase
LTTRTQILRSSTPGQAPAAGTRLAGELWTTFPDLQLGVIDASKNAQKLLAVRYFSTTANYAVGDYVVQAGQLYRAKAAVPAGAFNPARWTRTGGSVLVSATAPPTPTPGDMWFDSAGGQLYVYYNDGNSQQWVIAVNQNVAGGVYLPLSGGTLNGSLTLAADPAANLQAATKQYADKMLPLAGGALSGGVAINGVIGGSGTYKDYVLALNGPNGSYIGLNTPTAAGGNGVAGSVGGKQRWVMFYGDGTAETGSNAGSDFVINAIADDGATFIGQALKLYRSNASAAFGGQVTINGLLDAHGVIYSRAGIVYSQAGSAANNAHFYALDSTGAAKAIFYWDHTNNQVFMSHQDTGQSISIDNTGCCHLPIDVFAGQGYRCKQGSGGGYGGNRFNLFYDGAGNTQLWIDATNFGNVSLTSDYRIKKDIAPLPSMWERVKALDPISYTHQEYVPPSPPAAGQTPGGGSIEQPVAPAPLVADDDTERWGFIAHELQETLIESAATGYKDSPTHIQSPNPWTVIAALTKALQEAMARIEALEAGR